MIRDKENGRMLLLRIGGKLVQKESSDCDTALVFEHAYNSSTSFNHLFHIVSGCSDPPLPRCPVVFSSTTSATSASPHHVSHS